MERSEKDLDPQSGRLYAMEHMELRGHRLHRLPLKTIRRLARKVCYLYGIPEVSIRVYVDGNWVGSETDGKIQLDPELGMNGITLAHELAHRIVYLKHPRAQDHGPLFVLYYGALLHSLRLVPFDGFKAICRRHKVRIASTRKLSMREPVSATPTGRS
jgi:hypothetical protein